LLQLTNTSTSATEIAAVIDALDNYTSTATTDTVTLTTINAAAEATPIYTAVTGTATIVATTPWVDAITSDLAAASLEAAVTLHRNMKDGKGNFLDGADVYKLVVSPRLEKTALEILSGNNGFSAYSYEGSEAQNGNFKNFFISENGFRVELVVLKTVGQPDNIDWGTIGTDAMWFVINPLKKFECIKMKLKMLHSLKLKLGSVLNLFIQNVLYEVHEFNS